MLGSWHVPSHVAVRRGALKPSRDALSGGGAPCGRVGLFTPGRLAFSPSSLGLSQSARVLAYLATPEPESRLARVVEGA
jgi:hypothetical protein